jgi:hypothetical protein
MTAAPATLAGSLRVVLADLPPALIAPGLHGDLDRLAEGLAPVHRCGFEIRLGTASCSEVDFQQGITARDDDPGVLRAHLRRAADQRPARRRLEQFIGSWADDRSPLHAAIEDLWLEFDQPPASSLSVFVGFPRRPEPGDVRHRRAEAALDLLAGRPAWSGFAHGLARCFAACRDPAYISHVGLMLGRPSPFLRVNVKRLDPDRLGGFLREVGWGARPDAAIELASSLRPLVDGLTLCLDVGAQVRSRLGFEVHLDRQPAREPRWRSLLDALVAREWCTPPKRDALLAWPGVITPVQRPEAWPADLVRAALQRPADHLTTLERRLGHVKVVYDPAGPVEAKGYFGFEHQWSRPTVDPDPPDRPPATRRRAESGVAGTVTSGVDFLLASRTRAGWWRDFSGTAGAHEEWSTTSGWSDEWVSAFVATALASTRDARALQASRATWTLLAERRMPVAGWGYNRMLPVDGDSTAWGLLLAAATGAGDTWPARAARVALERHRLPDGGIASYRAAERPRPAAASVTPPDGSYAGWCATSHACVTAAAASLGDEPARDFLRGAQRADGSWAAYWWRDDEYATGLAAEALAASGREDDRVRVAAAGGWAAGRLGSDGAAGSSAFATAWLLRTLGLERSAAGVRGHREGAIAWLLRTQESDGGWPASARLVSPRPDLTDRPDSPAPAMACLDEARAFTTATVVSALAGGLT